MGQQQVDNYTDPAQLRVFMKSLLNDLRALERMLDEGMIESGARRIGAETVQYVSNIYKYYIAYRFMVNEFRLKKEEKNRAN